MKLEKWLEANDVRLDVRIQAPLDPFVRGTLWKCEIQGFLSTTQSNRPAVFITDRRGNMVEIVSYAHSPSQAYARAVAQLSGFRVNIVFRERDETFTFPEKLTP